MSDEDRTILQELAAAEIAKLSQLPGEVVRVCGPLTSGGEERYRWNTKRLVAAEDYLERQGFSVWRFEDSERSIKNRGYNHQDIMEDFHKPILASGLIKAAYFLPGSAQSDGASRERELSKQYGIECRDFPEAWFEEGLS